MLSTRAGSDMALIFGRRRIGKTFLLSNLWDREQLFHFTASSSTPGQNRTRLVVAMDRWSEEHYRPEDYPNWHTVFRLLLSMRAGEPLVIVLDEFQYLGSDADDLASVASVLNAVWEGTRVERPLLLVICGSAVGTMEGLARAGPLYGRFSYVAELQPFDYYDAARMAPFSDPTDRVRAYGIFGGIPHYLSTVDTDRSLAENAARECLAPRGEVRGNLETALIQEQRLDKVAQYQGIMDAVGAGRTSVNDIAMAADLNKDRALRRKLARLVDLGFIRKHRRFDAGKTDRYLYELEDPAFRFYYGFTKPNESSLEIGNPRTVWDRYVEPRLDTYMGHLFERVALQGCIRQSERFDLPPLSEWSFWEGVDPDGDSVEIDIVARLLDGRMMTGAVKWNRTPLDVRVHRDHLAALRRLEGSGRKWVHESLETSSPLVYVAAGGFSESFVREARSSRDEVYLLTLEDLFAGWDSPDH